MTFTTGKIKPKECRFCKKPITDWCFVVTREELALEKIYWVIICFECRDWAVENEVFVIPKMSDLGLWR